MAKLNENNGLFLFLSSIKSFDYNFELFHRSLLAEIAQQQANEIIKLHNGVYATFNLFNQYNTNVEDKTFNLHSKKFQVQLRNEKYLV